MIRRNTPPALLVMILLIWSMVPSVAMATDFVDGQIERLEEQIDRYEAIVQKGGWPAYTSRRKLTPGARHDAVITLREILTITGDLSEDGTEKESRQALGPHLPPPAPNTFDSRLEDAVKHFQERHGLLVDGIVGPASRRALAVSATERLAQLMLAKSTIHQFQTEQNDLDNAVLVNIPGYQLYHIEGGRQVGQMKVVVGQKDRKTPEFSNHIAYLEFNPRWYVPHRIAMEDILPKIQEDPEFPGRAGFKITQEGEPIDATTIDWSTVDQENFNFRLTQNSGRGNALGKVKFSIPNNRAIYLHDTSERHLFKRGYRALSSGCVRIEDPVSLMQFVLKHGHDISAKEAEEIYHSNRLKRLSLENPMPVHAVYWLATVPQDAGQPSFFADVYQRQGQEMTEKVKEIEAVAGEAADG